MDMGLPSPISGQRVYRYETGLQAALDDVAAALALDHAPTLPPRSPAEGPPSHEVPVRPQLETVLRAFYHEDFGRLGYS